MKRITKRTIIAWSVLLVVFLLFLTWNGAFDKPLSKEEIDSYAEKYQQLNPGADLNKLRDYLESDDGKPVIMVNVVKLYDTPNTIEGVQVFESSEETLKDYMGFVFPYLIKRGSYPIFTGVSVFDAMDVWGIEGAEEWTTAALLRYKSRRVMMEMATDPVFNQFHDSKVAAIEKTFALPVSSDMHFFDPMILVLSSLVIIGLIAQLMIIKKSNHKNQS